MSPLMAADVPHWCAPPHETINATWWRDHGVPKTPKGTPTECTMYQWTVEDGLDTNMTIPCSHGWSYDKRDYGETATSEWNLVCGDSWKRSAMQTTIMAGQFLGVIVFAKISDRLGRKRAFVAGIGILLTAGVSAAFAPSFLVFNLLRFVLSISTSGITVAVTTLFIETMPEGDRIYTTIGFGMGYAIPMMFIPLFSYYLRSFRYMQLAIGLSGLLLVPFILMLQESPKWLLVKRRLAEAEHSIVQIVKRNRRTLPNMEETMARLAARAETENAKKSSDLGYLDLLRFPVLRRNTIYLCSLWFSSSITFYYIALNAHRLPGNAQLNFAISTFADIPSALLSMYLIRHCRRRQTQMFNLSAAAAAFTAVFFLDESYRWTKIAGTFIVRLFVTVHDCVQWTNALEINPTPARSAGFALCMMFSRTGAMIAPFVKDIGDWTHHSVIYLVFVVFSASGVFCVWNLPETLNKKLPDTIVDIEQLLKETRRARAMVRASVGSLEMKRDNDQQQRC